MKFEYTIMITVILFIFLFSVILTNVGQMNSRISMIENILKKEEPK